MSDASKISYDQRSGTPHGCGSSDCDTTLIEPVDLFCRSHHNLLLMAGSSPWLRTAVGVIGCALTWGSFLATASLDSTVPVYLLLVLLGAGLTVLPLRHFPVARPAIAIGWTFAAVVAPILQAPTTVFARLLAAVTALVVAVAWAVRLGRNAYSVNREASSAGGTPGAALVATFLGAAVALATTGLLAAALRMTIFVGMPDGLVDVFLVGGLVAAGASLLILTGAAAVSCTTGWFASDARPLPNPRRPRRLPRPRRPQPAGPGTGTTGIAGRVLDLCSYVVVQLMAVVGDVLVYVLYYCTMRVLAAVANWLLLWLGAFARIAAASISLLLRAAWTATKTILVPAVGMLAGACLLVLFVDADLAYVQTGGLRHLGLLLGCAALAYALLTVTWLAVSGLPMKRSWVAVADMFSYSAGIAIVLLLVGGWGIGLFGTFGDGPISVGWLTLAATSCVVAASVVRTLRRKAELPGDPAVVPAASRDV